MRTLSWMSVALAATLFLAPSTVAGRGFDFDVTARADLEVEARAERGYRYTWDWGDGRTSAGATARHTYERPGVYHVVVVAVDDAGREYRRTREVEVRAEAPRTAASFDWELDEGRLVVEAEHERGARYEWDWGDGRTSRGRLATHVYAEPGTYEVVLKVTHRDGECTYERRTIVVREAAEVRHETRARASSPVSASVHVGWDHDHEDEDDRGERRSYRSEWRSESRLHSSSHERHDVPAAGGALVAALGAGVALVGRLARRP